MKPDASTVDTLQAFPFLTSPQLLDGLKQELPTYMAKAVDVGTDLNYLPGGRSTPVTFPIGLVQLAKLDWYSPHLQLQSVFFHI